MRRKRTGQRSKWSWGFCRINNDDMVSGLAIINPVSHAGAVGWFMVDFLVLHGSVASQWKKGIRVEIETPIPLGWPLLSSRAVNNSVYDCFHPVQVTIAEAAAACSAACALVSTGSGGGREGRWNGQDSELRYLLGNTSHSFTDWLAWNCHVQPEQPAQISRQSQRKDAPVPFSSLTV